MKLNIVCIGGGTGQSEILRGLKKYNCNITAIVAVTDSGRSTGVIRKKFDIPAPGDIRNCITALSDSEDLLTELFNYRFINGKDLQDLEGMSFGNLFLTALTNVKGDMNEAIKETGKILKIKGRVFPSTVFNTHVCAKLEDGQVVSEELNVRKPNKAPIKEIFLQDSNSKTGDDVVNAILRADMIVIGPGSLYTSVLVHFLLPNLKAAVRKSHAKKILVSNMITQAGQSDNYDILKHVTESEKYIGQGVLDYVLVNNNEPSKEFMQAYEQEGGYYMNLDKIQEQKIEKLGIKIITSDILKKKPKESEWNKITSIRHDPDKIASEIIKLCDKKKELRGVILTAGEGARMKPFSFSESKTMIKFMGKPLLAYHVDEMIKNNIKDITFICNSENMLKIKNYFNSNYSDFKIRFHYFIQYKQKGPAHALLSAEKHLRGSHFVVKYGDSLSSEDQIQKIIEMYNLKKDSDVVITLRKVKNPAEYGVARFENEKLVEIIEKPKIAPSDFANVGLFILNGDLFFDALHEIGYETIITPPQYLLKKEHKSSYWVTSSKRIDIGRPWNIISATKMVAQKYPQLLKHNEIACTHISPNAKIDETAYIAPNSYISDGVQITGYSSVDGYIGKDSKIHDSIIMSGTKIGKNCEISNSVIGKNNIVDDNFKTIIGDKNTRVYSKGQYIKTGLNQIGVFIGEGVKISENITSQPGKIIYPNKIITSDIVSDKIIYAIMFDADNTLYKTKLVAEKSDMSAMGILSKGTTYTPEVLYTEWKNVVMSLKDKKEPHMRSRRYSYDLLAIKLGLKNVNFAYQEFLKTVIENIKEMPNLKQTIPILRQFRLSVITEDSSELAIPKLKKFGLYHLFDYLVTSDKVGEMKPSKEYYKLVFDKFRVIPNECLVIGDNYEKDLEFAKEFGAKTILFGNTKNGKSKSDFEIDDYIKLPEILKNL